MSTIVRICEMCGAPAHRFRDAKQKGQRKLRRMRLCEKHSKRWDRNGRLEVLPRVVNEEQVKAIGQLFEAGEGPSSIASTLGIPRLRVHRTIEKIKKAAQGAG